MTMTKIMNPAGEIEQYASAPAPADVPVYGPAEQITVGELQPGDYVTGIPTQQRVRGISPASAVRTCVPDWEHWQQRISRRGGWNVESRKLTFISGPCAGTTYNIPASFTVTVRRPATEGTE
jgi:hypothetical protein